MHHYKHIDRNDLNLLLKKNEEDRIRAEKERKLRDKGFDLYSGGWTFQKSLMDVHLDRFMDGSIGEYPHGTVIKQAERSFYYRGENQIFKSSSASLWRKLNEIKDKEKALAEEFVSYMRIADFLWLLLEFQHTQEFIASQFSFNNKPVSVDLLYEQIAQHYGLETTWLDITSDFEVALFFACCKFNSEMQNWVPLTEKDFNYAPETKFGVIFRRSSRSLENDSLPSTERPNATPVLPVGFQPFMRCHMQNSYVIKMNKSSCLQKNPSFEKLRFMQSEELCNYIFNKMEGGKKIYPNEGLTLIIDEIEKIKQKKEFSIETFDFASEEPQFKSYGKEKLKQLIDKHGYKIMSSSNYIAKEKIALVNKKYKGFDIEKTYDIKIRSRKVFESQKKS